MSVSVFQLLDEFHLDLLQLKRSFLCFWGVGILQNIFVLYKYMLYIVGVCVCSGVCVSVCFVQYLLNYLNNSVVTLALLCTVDAGDAEDDDVILNAIRK